MGILVNTAAVLVGATLGLLFRGGLSYRFEEILTKGLGLCVLYIGISGTLKGENQLIAILSVAIGGIIGEALRLDDRLNSLSQKIENKLSKPGKTVSIAKGFSTATLLFCVGAMAIVGSINSGLMGDNSTLYAKSILDGIFAAVLCSTLGIGVMFSAVAVLVYQGAIFLVADFAAPFLTASVNEMTCAGSILIMALGLNMLKLTDIKVMNLLPAVFIPIILCLIF